MNPKVSVIIPTYNRSVEVRNAIQSVLSQTFTDFEVVVIDDGSSDDTEKALAETFGDRIRYYFQTNQGLSAALNKGLTEARGEWVAFLDSDDFWEKEKLEWEFKALDQFSQCGACYTDVRFFNNPETRTMFQLADEEDRHEKAMDISPNVLKLVARPGGAGMVVCICSVIARADLVRRAGGFDTNLRFGMDSDFLFRLARLTEFCYVNLPLTLVDRSPAEERHVGVSSEWNKLEFVLRQTQIRLEKFLRQSDGLPTKMRKLILAGLSSVHSGLTNCHLQTGEYGKAREAVSQAAKLDLTFNIAVKWLLTWISPRLALRAVQRHQQRTKDMVPFV